MAVLLDDLGVAWRKRLASGQTFADLLAEAAAFDAATAAELAETAYRRQDLRALEQRFAAEPAAADLYAPFASHAGTRLVLHGFRVVHSNSIGEFSDAVPRVRVYGAGTSVVAEGPGGSFEVRGPPVMFDQRTQPASWVMLLESAIRVGGAPPSPGTSTRDRVTISAEGLELRLDVPATISWDGSALTVRLPGSP
jgi:hypothetical protein